MKWNSTRTHRSWGRLLIHPRERCDQIWTLGHQIYGANKRQSGHTAEEWNGMRGSAYTEVSPLFSLLLPARAEDGNPPPLLLPLWGLRADENKRFSGRLYKKAQIELEEEKEEEESVCVVKLVIVEKGSRR